jgi:hypothetical protein
MLAFLGAALGVGFQVYMTYILPDFMDTARFTTSLVQGLIVGSVFGLGVFIIRVVMERFQASAAALKILVGTLMGGLILNIALLVFHVLFLNTPPHGLLITAACGMIALTFAVSGLFRSRLPKMLLSSASVFAAIIGAWWLHTNFAASLSDLTPLFRYDYAWPLTRIALTALGVALPVGILGNLVNLSIVEE